MSTGLTADISPAGEDALIRYGIDHIQIFSQDEMPLRIAPATYLVAMKLRDHLMSQQDQDLRDIRSILALSLAQVDLEQVAAFAAKDRASDAWQSCLKGIGQE